MNSKNSDEKMSLDELVDRMMEENNHNPRDFCFRLIVSKYPTINVEHQTSPLISDKIGIIYDYKLFLIHKTNIPSNSIVITNIDPGKQEIYYESHDQMYKVKYIVVTYEDISKRLSILDYKIKNRDFLSKVAALNFTVIAIFVKGNETKQIMEKTAFLYSKVDRIDLGLQLDIHQVLKK